MVSKALFSSKSDEWSTPSKIYDDLNKEFNFNLDPCASENNHKCENYFTIEDDGLSKNWGDIEYFVILLTQILRLGLKRLGKRVQKIILLLSC